MRIVYVVSHYHPYVGGVEYVVKSLAERLAGLGHEVSVVAGQSDITAPQEEQVDGVKVIRWPTWTLGDSYHLPRVGEMFGTVLAGIMRDADVAHVHSVHSVLSVYAGMKVKESSPETRLILTPHYHGQGHSWLRKRLWVPWRKYVSKVVQRADRLHAVSALEEERILRSFPGESRQKITVIPNGIESDVLRHAWTGSASDYALYAGRVERYKMIQDAMAFANSLGLRLVVVGKGPYLAEAKRQAEATGARVEFLPPLPREEYLRAMAGARCIVNLSREEAFSIFVAEALGMGVPAYVSSEIAKIYGRHDGGAGGEPLLLRGAAVKSWDDLMERYLRLYDGE